MGKRTPVDRWYFVTFEYDLPGETRKGLAGTVCQTESPQQAAMYALSKQLPGENRMVVNVEDITAKPQEK